MKIKIFTIVGARPQFIKAAAISRAIRLHFSETLEEYIVHTGQHYDSEMSDVFFEELQIPKPAFHLHAGSGKHGEQTATMLNGIENLLLTEKPDVVLVYGDTNSTLAGALAASKIHIPVIHVEAGLRSYNKAMPEELNRILTDHVSTILFTPTQSGLLNLKNEGFKINQNQKIDSNQPLVLHCGDVMYDNALFFKQLATDTAEDWFETLKLEKGGFYLATVHRNTNTDDKDRLKSILSGLIEASEKFGWKTILPLHPRTLKMIQVFAKEDPFFLNLTALQIIAPVSYLQMVLLESQCGMVITDSGGVQKEAYFYEKPCIVLRPETEWVELVDSGAAILVDADKTKLLSAISKFSEGKYPAPSGFYGDGKAAELICRTILKVISR